MSSAALFLYRLLRKVDFLTYKSDNNHRAATIRARYHLTGTLDYEKYNRLAGSARQLAHKLSNLDPSDPFRKQLESQMLDKFYDMGILKQNREQGVGLSAIERDVTVSAFARRRLGVVMKRIGMVENVAAVSEPFFFFLSLFSCFFLGYISMLGLAQRANDFGLFFSIE